MFVPVCGNGIPEPGEDCDEGAANSDQPNASCRTDCTPARCGDGVVDDAAGEECEGDSDCASPNECQDCECVAPLGTRVISASGLGIIPSPVGAALGQVSGRLVLNAGAPDADGVAMLNTPPGPFYIAVNIPIATQTVCHRITFCTGAIYCNGGTDAVVRTELDSLMQGLTCQVATTPSACQTGGPCCTNACEGLGVGSGNSPVTNTSINPGTGAGGLVVLECRDSTVFGPLGTNCATLTYGPERVSVYTTGSSTAAITNECPPDAATNRRATVSATGENFQCSSWSVENGPGKLLIPAVAEQPDARVAGDVAALILVDD